MPYIAAGIGGIATQALVNPYYGIDGLKLLREGSSPRDIVDDPDRSRWRPRPAGNCTSWMPAAASPRIPARDCVDWCGHIEGDGFSIAGNMLAGARVLDDTAQAYTANARRCRSRSA